MDEKYGQMDPWSELFESLHASIFAPDVTATWEWHSALVDSGMVHSIEKTIRLVDDGVLTGIVPLVRSGSQSVFGKSILSPASEAYSGRADLLLRPPADKPLQSLFDNIQKTIDNWQVFIFTLCENSESHQALERLMKKVDYRLLELDTFESPYITFNGTWDDYFSSLPKKLRWTIRKSEKDLIEMGNLSYAHYTRDTDIPSLVDAMLRVEENSWKEAASTSITKQQKQKSFYEALLPVAAKAGYLNAHVLSLDDAPIAYILGLSHRKIFHDLKESFDERLRKYSPGHVLKRFAFPELLEQGHTYYDFMGECENYKMKWTRQTYKRRQYALFNYTVRGQFEFLKSRLARRRASGI